MEICLKKHANILAEQFNNKTIGVTTYQTLARLQGILMAECFESEIAPFAHS